MLEGLEIKEKDFSSTYLNKDFRIDSQFYTKEPAKNSKLKYEKIGNIIKKAQYGASIAMNEDGVGYPIYRMNEIHNMLCDMEVSKFADISKNELKTFTLNDRDVVFNRTNSFEWVGRTGLYKKLDNRDFVFASYLVRFIPNEDLIFPEYLSAFLNSKQGVWDIKRRARQSINQTNVNPEEVKEIEIPLLSKPFQENLKECFDKAFELLIDSKSAYTQAEQLLLQELNLADFQPSQEPVNVKSFSESFGSSGRLDAEYYQVKYDDVENQIISYKNGYSTLGNQIDYIKTGEYSDSYISKSKGSSYYLRNTNISKGEIIPDENYSVDSTKFQCSANLNEVLTSRVGTIGLFGVINESLVNSVYSDNILCFKLVDDLNPYVYSILFSSQPYQLLLEKLAGGSVQPLITQTSIKTLVIPIIDQDKQQQIADLVEESFNRKKQSEHLLEIAKQAVEMAIEQDEERAMGWIKEQTNE